LVRQLERESILVSFNQFPSLLIIQRTLSERNIIQRCTLLAVIVFFRSTVIRPSSSTSASVYRSSSSVRLPSSVVNRLPSSVRLPSSPAVIRSFYRSTTSTQRFVRPTRSSKFLFSRVASCASCCRLLVQRRHLHPPSTLGSSYH